MIRNVSGDVYRLRSKESKRDSLIRYGSLVAIVLCSVAALVLFALLLVLSTNEDYCKNAANSRKASRKELWSADGSSALSEDSGNCSRVCVGVLLENGSVIPLPLEFANASWDHNASFRVFPRRNNTGTRLLLKLFKNKKELRAQLVRFSNLNYTVARILFSEDVEGEGFKSITLDVNEEFISIVFSLGVVLFIIL